MPPTTAFLNQDQVFDLKYDIVTQFSFPYAGYYSVQEDLICNLYNFLRHTERKLGLFSSPTGTGKSLSLICSVLTYHMDGPWIKAKSDEVNQKSNQADDLDEWSKLFAAGGGSDQMKTSEDQKEAKAQKNSAAIGQRKRVYNFIDASDIKAIKKNREQMIK